ncbi:MAG: hypothetical protein ABI461_11175 [Polyangiaceae bacterium]
MLFAGCSTPDGSQGGRCKQGCNNNYCDDGECDNTTNTCVSSLGPQTPPTGCNFNGADSRCASGQIGYQCLGGSTPALGGSDVPGCTYASQIDSSGNALYCCTPSCEERATPRCGASSSTSICSGPATPEDGHPSTTCIALFGYWGITEYCCAPADTCFAGPPDVFLEPECSPDKLTLCTGSATPSQAGVTCAAIALDGGAGVSGYCCSPPISDAGGSD